MESCSRFGPTPLQSVRLRNPFLVKIEPNSLRCNNYTDGVEISIVCECSFWIFSFWGVKIENIHYKMLPDWNQLKYQLIDNKFIDDLALFSNDPELYQSEYNKIVHKIPSPNNFDPKIFGSNQRDRYPLVVILALNDRDIEDQVEINDVVCLMTVIHIKDGQLPLDTSIIAQYIKRKSGQVMNLQSLYTMEDGSSGDASPKCCICLDRDVSVAFIPCRHTCVCVECFNLIDSCPICRSSIGSYISLNQTRQLPEPEAEIQPKPQKQSWFSKVINYFN